MTDKARPIVVMSALVLIGLAVRPAVVHSLDPPHNGQNSLHVSMTCNTCHYDTSLPPPSWVSDPTTTDNTYFNKLCRGCHVAGIVDPKYIVKTHSSGNISNKYGNWTIECRFCHNPHYQDQISSYPTDTTSDLFSGTIASYAQAPVSALTSTIYVNASGLNPNAWIDYMLVPNIAYPTRMYRILSNTANAFTVLGSIDGRYAQTGSSFGVRLSSLLLAQLTTPSGTIETVKFFTTDPSKPNSYASSTNAANVTGICQVCHTQTRSFNRTGVTGSLQEGLNHPEVIASGQKCTGCHIHTEGFKGSCNACHGYPPKNAATLIFLNKTGQTVTSDSGSGPGAHVLHVDSLKLVCANCHFTGMLSGASAGDDRINIGFNYLNGRTTGSYDGKSGRTVYPYTGATTGNTFVCSNIYCHGSTMAPNGGTDTTPVWNDPSTGACGACHGASASIPPTRGSHYKHSRNDLLGYAYPCSYCHQDPAGDASLHVNGQSEVRFSTAPAVNGGIYDGTHAMLDAYGACMNIYCHSTVQSSPPGGAPVYRVTPNWGNNNTLGCAGCHDYAAGLATGSHGKHMQISELQECWACHNYTGIDDGCVACHDPNSIEPKRDMHANHAINVSLTPRYGGNYSGSPAPGDAYGKCTNVYCHSTVQSSPPGGAVTYASPTWGNAASAQCGTCHRGDGVQGNGSLMASGTHAAHVGLVTPSGSVVYACGTCHAGRGAGTDFHADKNIDVSFDPIYGGIYTGTPAPGDAYGSCANIYCHSTVQGASDPTQPPQYKSPPPWGQTISGICGMGACHDVGYPHTEDASSGSFTKLTTGSHGKHLLYKFDQLGNCEACHYRTGNCQDCHVFHGGETHVDRVITVAFDPDFPAMPTGGGGGIYSGDPAPRTPYGSCTDLYCHSPGTALSPPYGMPNVTPVTWGTGTLSTDCAGCHGGDRNAAVPMATGSHKRHVVSNPVDCVLCHARTVADSRTLNPAVYSGARTYGYHYHVNGWVNIAYSGIAGTGGTYAGQPSPVPNRAPGSVYGSCGNLYCHSTAQGTADPADPPAYAAPAWGDPASGKCGTCHATGAHSGWGGWATKMSSGSHGKHLLYEFNNDTAKCQVCHNVVEDWNPCTVCHVGGTDPAKASRVIDHVDGQINVSFRTSVTGSASYSGDPAPRTPYGDCVNTYCHSNGTSVATGTVPANSSPIWGAVGPLSCGACHGNPPAYASGSPKANSHMKHTALACAGCHQTTAAEISTGTAFIYHANQVYDVYPSASSYFTYSASISGGSCGSIACHGYTSATWGAPGTFSCVDVDGDGVCLNDNCPTVSNPGQQDADGDGVGDACDSWSSIGAGMAHSLARRVDGTLWAWGSNWQGQLGDGTGDSRSFPVQVNGDTNWTQAAGGENHTLALKSDGSLWAWGNNSRGAVGDGTGITKYSPVRIGSGTDWTAIEAGLNHSLALKADRTLWAWGIGEFGTLGNGSTADKMSPTQVGSDTDWTAVSGGVWHTLAVKADGTLWAWGTNAFGQLGTGIPAVELLPVKVGADTDWVAVSAGLEHSFGLKSDGTIWAWGDNTYGQLGDGTRTQRTTPVKINNDTDWTSVTTFWRDTLAVKSDGSLWTWGSSYQWISLSPIQVGMDTNWAAIAVGGSQSLGLRSDGSMWSWNFGELTPVRID